MRSDHPLTALRDITTNSDISGFPHTPADLANMTGVEITAILRALDLPVGGTLAGKKRRLKFYMGIPNVP
jgi:hypothetical protein